MQLSYHRKKSSASIHSSLHILNWFPRPIHIVSAGSHICPIPFQRHRHLPQILWNERLLERTKIERRHSTSRIGWTTSLRETTTEPILLGQHVPKICVA